jgi:four helix bundle protein
VSGGNGGMQAQRGYRKLLAFQSAHDLVIAAYRVTNGFPKSEQFGLTSQMRRAAVSVAANIVEGNTVGSSAMFSRHLAISLGSCKELDYYFDLALELGYVNSSDLQTAQQKCVRAAYLVTALWNSIRNRAQKKTSEGGSNPSVPSVPSALSAPSEPEVMK